LAAVKGDPNSNLPPNAVADGRWWPLTAGTDSPSVTDAVTEDHVIGVELAPSVSAAGRRLTAVPLSLYLD